MKPGAPERHRDGSGRESGRVEGQEAGAGDRGQAHWRQPASTALI